MAKAPVSTPAHAAAQAQFAAAQAASTAALDLMYGYYAPQQTPAAAPLPAPQP